MAGRRKQPGFEEALNELEDIVAQLESGDPSLEESLKLFEKGIALTRLTQKTLDSAEQKVQKLSEPLNADAELEDLDHE